eukprot:1161623-Pelagomonas_calceolata.AAC.1
MYGIGQICSQVLQRRALVLGCAHAANDACPCLRNALNKCHVLMKSHMLECARDKATRCLRMCSIHAKSKARHGKSVSGVHDGMCVCVS